MITYSTSICLTKTLLAPLDRLRFLSQTRHMSNVSNLTDRLTGSSATNLSKIVKEQGATALWRGNNSNIYRNIILIFLRVNVYDRIKNSFMPNEISRYQGIDYYWRLVASASLTMGFTAAITYPFDLINTRLSCDMTKAGEQRLFTTTFDCFNRTNLDEGFKVGLYKGIELSMLQSILRASLTLPMLDIVRSNAMTGNQAIQ